MPRADHRLIIKSPAGVRRGELIGTSAGLRHGGFVSLATSIHVNAPGTLVFKTNANSAVIDSLDIDSQVEHWRDDQMIFRALYQGPHYETDERGQEVFTATCVGEKHLLTRAANMWAAKTINRSLFTESTVEMIAKTLVTYNLTAEASVLNGRLLDHPERRIIVEADSGRGTVLATRENMGKQVLDELQELADAGNIDFDLIQIAANQWEFRVYEGQRGRDLRQRVMFSRDRGNMGQIVSDTTRIDEKNVVVVGGSGVEDDREFAVRYGPDYTPAQHRELFVAATSESGVVALQAQGDKELDDRRIRPKLTFQAIQAARTRFGIDYTVGDLVSASYRSLVNIPFQVVGATISVDPGQNEQIVVELEQQ